MTHRWTKFACLFALAIPLATHAQQIDLTHLDKGTTGPRAQVLVLGSVHLRDKPDGFKPESLDPVLDRLAAFKPDIITVEALSGETCDLVARHPSVYNEDWKTYCGDTAEAKAATGLDVPAAIAEVNSTLKAWPAEPTPAQRRHLAALFLAANERASALVQWLQLPEAERRADDGLDSTLVAALNKSATRSDESAQIGARLAARLGLQRVHSVDDHFGDNIDIADVKTFVQELTGAWQTGDAAIAPIRKRTEELWSRGDMLALYRHINSADVQRITADTEVGTAMRAKSPHASPRVWVAGWETRNLRMVANIRSTFRERPNARVLSIVGSSHKPWFDSWLGQMQGVDIVDTTQVLK
jgi:hypothetical protein